MIGRHTDGSAGDADYGVVGDGYAQYRRPEPAIASLILCHLGAARFVLNVGAGAGSYEPQDREVIAVEPSAVMRAQRAPGLAPAVGAVAERLPFDDHVFDACLASFTVHQWTDPAAGLREMRRVTRGAILVLTCDPARVTAFWLNAYAPGVLAAEARRYPRLSDIGKALGGRTDIHPVGIPLQCRDGFNEAYYGRPEALLEEGARRACSGWSFVPPEIADASVAHLAMDLANGVWDRRYGCLRRQPTYDGSLRLLVSTPADNEVTG